MFISKFNLVLAQTSKIVFYFVETNVLRYSLLLLVHIKLKFLHAQVHYYSSSSHFNDCMLFDSIQVFVKSTLF